MLSEYDRLLPLSDVCRNVANRSLGGFESTPLGRRHAEYALVDEQEATSDVRGQNRSHA